MDVARIEHLIGAVEDGNLRDSPLLVQTVVRALDACKLTVFKLFEAGVGYDDPVFGELKAWIDHNLDKLRSLLVPSSEATDLDFLEWSKGTLNHLATWIPAALTEVSIRGPRNTALTSENALELAQHLQTEANDLALDIDTAILREKAAGFVEEAREARDAAQSAAGLTATAKWGSYFGAYARREGRASLLFRFSTVLVILSGALGVVLMPAANGGTLAEISSRVAIVGATAALSTYFGRQAGQHRRLHNWARTVQVQLDSFPAFIAAVPEEERGEVFRTLSRRVLSAPPEKVSDSSENSVGPAQLLDLVTALAKRVSP